MQLENSLVMYGIYNTETLEQLINTVHHIHITIYSYEKLYAGQQSSLSFNHYVEMHRAYNTIP